jgi:Tol biopolymer transport system component/serine/threonine protein kinase
MGIVFRARDTRLGREVALKCPWPKLSTDPVSRHRFLREARATSRLAHPTIVPVYEVFEDRDLPWIAMELVEGRTTLAELLVSGDPLPLEQILPHAEDLTDALRAAHAKGILHRDIKPSNVLLGTDGRARLTDFGLAIFFETSHEPAGSPPSDAGSQVTEEGKVVGTLAYMAPEVLLGTKPDPRSDLFSWGVVLYEMCTGRAAFGPSSKWDAYNAVLHREPPAIGRFNYEIPRSLERIVRKALAKRPDERYQDARDMLADIRTIRRKMASGSWSAEDDLDVERPRTRRLIWALAGVAVASLGAAAWMALSKPHAPTFELLGDPHPLTSAPGAETQPAVSPDGNLVAYASDESGNFDLWLVDARGGNPIRLTDDAHEDSSPAWFPDGSALAFVSDRGGSSAIWKVAALGGSATLLVPDAESPAISPDGRRIAFTRRGPSGDPRVMLATIGAVDKTAPLCRENVGQWGQLSPAWSPDGTRIAFADHNHLWVASVADGSARQVTESKGVDSNPVWSSDGRSLLFSSFRGEAFALWRVEVESGRLERLTYGSGPEVEPSVDRRGDKLVFTTHSSDARIVVRDLATGVTNSATGYREDLHPALSPDGKTVIFTSDRWGGPGSIATESLDGTRLLSASLHRVADFPAALPRFSPDGKWIAFWRVIDDARDIWIMPSEGGEATRFTDDPAADIHPAWSPDGRRIAFASERAGGSHIWVGGVANGRAAGPAYRVTSGPGTDMQPEWSPDATRLAFIRIDQHSSDVWLVGQDGRGERRLTVGAGATAARWFGALGTLLVSGRWGGAAYEVRELDLASGRIQPLSPPLGLGRDEVLAIFNIDAKGNVLVYNSRSERGDVWMIDAPAGRF